MNAASRSTFSFALGLQTLCRAERRGRLIPTSRSRRQSSEEASRQSHVQPVRSHVAPSQRPVGRAPVPASAGQQIDFHFRVPTPLPASSDGNMNPIWVPITLRAGAIAQ